MQRDFQSVIDELQKGISQVRAILEVVSMSQALHGQPEALVLEVARDQSDRMTRLVSQAGTAFNSRPDSQTTPQP